MGDILSFKFDLCPPPPWYCSVIDIVLYLSRPLDTLTLRFRIDMLQLMRAKFTNAGHPVGANSNGSVIAIDTQMYIWARPTANKATAVG